MSRSPPHPDQVPRPLPAGSTPQQQIPTSDANTSDANTSDANTSDANTTSLPTKDGPTNPPSTCSTVSLLKGLERYAHIPFVMTFLAVWRRLKQDQVFKLAAMLAYYLPLSVIPILVLLLSILGLVLAALSPPTRHELIAQLVGRVPAVKPFLPLALERLQKQSGALAMFSVLTSIYFGVCLFKTIDYCFGIIFRVSPRPPVAEHLMAVKMLLCFLLLVPVLVVISTIPGFLSKQGIAHGLFGDSVIAALGVILLSVGAGWLVASVLFLVTYVVVPNRHVPVHLVWKGALIAGALLEIYHIGFPLYAARYLDGSNDAATAGFALVVVVFFYYFGLILLVGAEINGFLYDRQRRSRDRRTIRPPGATDPFPEETTP